MYLMRHKSETFKIVKEYKAEVENHRGKSTKSLRSNLGGGYLLGEFRQYLEDHGITSQMSAPGQPQQNGVVERRNETLLDMVKLMMSYASWCKTTRGKGWNTLVDDTNKNDTLILICMRNQIIH